MPTLIECHHQIALKKLHPDIQELVRNGFYLKIEGLACDAKLLVNLADIYNYPGLDLACHGPDHTCPDPEHTQVVQLHNTK